MANDLNQCNFIGRLGRDVELRYMPSGDAIASFSLAVGSSWNDKNTGEKKEQTEWVNVSVFGKLADICGKFLRKGSKVYISGRMKTDKYQKDGVDVYSTKIIAENMQMLDGKPADGGEQSSAPAPAPRQQAPAPKPAPAPSFDDMDDTIPF